MQRYLKKAKNQNKPDSNDRGNESSESFSSDSSDDDNNISGLDCKRKNDLNLKMTKLKMENNTFDFSGEVEDPFVFWAPLENGLKDENFNFSLLNDIAKDSMDIDFLEDQVADIPQGIVGSSCPWKYFEAFFPEKFIEDLTIETNLYAEQSITIMKKENRLLRYSRVKRWKKITKDHIRKYIGIVLWSGLISNKDLKGILKLNES